MAKTKTTPNERRAIVVSKNRPKIVIRHAGWFVRVTIPGYIRQTIGLAHAIVAAFAREASDEIWSETEIVIGPGDHLHTCTTIDISIPKVTQHRMSPMIVRTKLAFRSSMFHDLVSRAVMPVYGVPAFDVIEESTYVKKAP